MRKPETPKEKIVFALDVNTLDEVKELVKELKDHVGTFKVGLQLITSVGPDAIRVIQDEGANIFFDGKFHDIPNTVAKACANLVKHKVTFFNVHLQGGSKMIASAIKEARDTARKNDLPKPIILGASLLSSFGQRTLTEELCVNKNIDEYTTKLTELAKTSGLDGIISPANDTPKIRKICGDDFIVLCPAIRPTWSVVNDQIRVVTPTDAVLAGVDYMVVGRPISMAKDRVAAAQLIADEIQNAMENKTELMI